jgi:hypothetical protein
MVRDSGPTGSLGNSIRRQGQRWARAASMGRRPGRGTVGFHQVAADISALGVKGRGEVSSPR